MVNLKNSSKALKLAGNVHRRGTIIIKRMNIEELAIKAA